MSDPTYLDFTGPAELRARGTVLVVPGRGESQAAYRRFGVRLAADSYRVRVLTAPTVTGEVAGTLDLLAVRLAAAVSSIGPDGPPGPLVLVGSDTGAAAIAALLARFGAPDAAWWPAGAVLAGLPGYGAHRVGGWEDELAARTHCTVHRGVLSGDPTVTRGSLSDPVPGDLLDAAYGSTVDLPQLVLAGDADPLADRDALTRGAKALPRIRLAVVRGAHHDVLNDLQHRAVAAEIVSFLEVLRSDPPLAPIVDVQSSAW
jgi:alpha-beta hydrolase superfamily lysophospholipase